MTSSKAPQGASISGQIMLTGATLSSAAVTNKAASAASCVAPKVSLWSVSAANTLTDLALSTTVASDGSFAFAASQTAALNLNSNTVKYFLRVQGCDQDYSRPLTGVSGQNISYGSSLFGLSMNSNGADLSKVAVTDAGKILQSLEALNAASQAGALQALINSPQTSQDFFAITSGTPAALYAALPNSQTPSLHLSTLPNAISNNTSLSINILGTPGSLAIDHFECSLDSAAYSRCTSPFHATSLTQGSHSVGVRAVDQAGTLSVPATASWIVDLSAPVVSWVTRPSLILNATTSAVAFSAADTGGGSIASFSCQLDQAAATSCVSPLSLTNLASGPHTITVSATDTAGNASAPLAYSWTVELHDRMYVDGSVLRNQDGTRLIAKGSVLYVMAYDDGYNESEWTNTLSKRDAIFSKMQSLGINTVRIPISNNSSQVVTYAGGATAYLNSLDLLIQSAHAHGLIVDLCWWGPLFDGSNWPTTSASYLPYFDAAVAKWGSDPKVYFEPGNEPNGVTWAQWQTAMQSYIRRFRADGYTGPLLIDTINWSWSFDPVQVQTLITLDASLLSGKSNLIFSNHQYANNNSCFNCGTVQSSWETAVGQYTATFPILEGEVGSYNGSSFANSTTWYSEFLAYLSGTKIDNGLNGGYVFAWHWGDTNSNTNSDYLTLGTVGVLANTNFWTPLYSR